MGYFDTDVAEYLYKNKPQIDSLTNFLCNDLSKACSSKPPPVPKVTALWQMTVKLILLCVGFSFLEDHKFSCFYDVFIILYSVWFNIDRGVLINCLFSSSSVENSVLTPCSHWRPPITLESCIRYVLSSNIVLSFKVLLIFGTIYQWELCTSNDKFVRCITVIMVSISKTLRVCILLRIVYCIL